MAGTDEHGKVVIYEDEFWTLLCWPWRAEPWGGAGKWAVLDNQDKFVVEGVEQERARQLVERVTRALA